MKMVDISGKSFGRLTAIARAGYSPSRQSMWECKCSCGQYATCGLNALRTGRTKSCGCLNADARRGRLTGNQLGVIHSKSRTPEYKSWQGMKDRCLNPNCKDWENYGGRGIGVCAEWRQDFMAFYRHVGPKPGPRYSIDRIDNNRGYEPGNVRWATPIQQTLNRRCQNAAIDL